MKQIAIIGGGGHAKVVISVMRAVGLRPVCVFDDDASKHGTLLLEVPITGPLSQIDATKYDGAVIAVGNNQTRAKIAAGIALPWLTAIHPNACIDPTVKLGPGTVVFAGAVIQPDAIIGAHVIVNTGATIDHDCIIGDFVHIAPGVHLAGDVQVGARSFLGIGTVAIPGMRIGSDTFVGAGAAIIRSLPDDAMAYGVPAKTQSRPE